MAKILIVEDEAAIAHAYSIVLEQAGCEVDFTPRQIAGIVKKHLTS